VKADPLAIQLLEDLSLIQGGFLSPPAFEDVTMLYRRAVSIFHSVSEEVKTANAAKVSTAK
jgi:hypothetical protein